MAKLSYFAEVRIKNNNQNYFNTAPINDIEKSVKRIIRDIIFDNITENDYQYFLNQRLLQVCIKVADTNYRKADIEARALMFYINEILNKNFSPFPSINMDEERNMAIKSQTDMNIKAGYWKMILDVFHNISYGYDPIQQCTYIKNIDRRFIDIIL